MSDEESQYAANYDRAVTLFSPDGRLLQLEYARVCINRGTLSVVLSYDNGSTKGIIAGTVVSSSILYEEKSRTKIFKISNNIWATMSGIVSDANFLIKEATQYCNDYRFNYEEEPSLTSIVNYLSEILHGYTCIGGMRPMGTALVIFGIDPNGDIKIAETDPSGSVVYSHACAIGLNKTKVIKDLEKNYVLSFSESEGEKLVRSYLVKYKSPESIVRIKIVRYNKNTEEITNVDIE